MAFKYVPIDRVKSFGPTVWHEFSPLAKNYNSINLGQGFPDFNGPEFVLKAAHKAIDGGASLNQYARSGGHIKLTQTLANMYGPLFGRTINPMDEIVTTVGASEGLYSTIQALVGPGDEVIVIEPVFDIYMGAIVMSGATPKFISLKPKPTSPNQQQSAVDWTLDLNELESLITDKTKLFIINNPHNPTGKVFTRKELEDICNIVKKFPQLAVVSDEVYEWMVFDDAEHSEFPSTSAYMTPGLIFGLSRIATLPDMWERTLTIASSGKTFSITGWKIGWIIGPKYLIQAVMNVHQYIPFSICTPLQEAVADAFEEAQKTNYFKWLKDMYQKKRDFLVKALKDAGLEPVVPQGTYFVMADMSNVVLHGNEGKEKTVTGMNVNIHDWNLCRFLTTDIGVAAIPMSAFYANPEQHADSKYARFTFCKTDEVLEEAAKRLLSLKSSKNYVKPT